MAFVFARNEKIFNFLDSSILFSTCSFHALCLYYPLYMLRNLTKVSTTSGTLLFNQKIKPIVFYGIGAIAKYLKTTHLLEIDKVKSYFLKRLLKYLRILIFKEFYNL